MFVYSVFCFCSLKGVDHSYFWLWTLLAFLVLYIKCFALSVTGCNLCTDKAHSKEIDELKQLNQKGDDPHNYKNQSRLIRGRLNPESAAQGTTRSMRNVRGSQRMIG
ncbi:hypothetical protein HA466_0292800 [Hirschfeldia incana]|nr:hypothetical protein HA466_0292800 [Hirschfeldia incana]